MIACFREKHRTIACGEFARDGQRHGAGVRALYRQPQADIRPRCGAARLGIASLPQFVAADDVRAGRLRQVLADWSASHAHWGHAYLLYPAHRQFARKVR